MLPQRTRDLQNAFKAEIALASLNAAHVCGVKACLLRQELLCEVQGKPKLPDTAPESFSICFHHHGSDPAMQTMSPQTISMIRIAAWIISASE